MASRLQHDLDATVFLVTNGFVGGRRFAERNLVGLNVAMAMPSKEPSLGLPSDRTHSKRQQITRSTCTSCFFFAIASACSRRVIVDAAVGLVLPVPLTRLTIALRLLLI